MPHPRKKRRGIIAALHDRFVRLALLITSFSLAAVILCLELIGPPPRWRIDALWVHGHSRTVRIMFAAMAGAAAATLVLLLVHGRGHGGRRAWLILMWLAAIVACFMLYWDRLPIIFNVVRRHG